MSKYGKWLTHGYLERNGKVRKGISRPRRERLAVRAALQRMGNRYKELVPFYNPLYNGWKGTTDGSIKWADFLVYSPQHKRMFCIQFNPRYPSGGLNSFSRNSYEAMQKYFEKRNIPMITVERHWTSAEMEVKLRMFIRRLEKNE